MRVPAAPISVELPKIKGSRFIAHLAPAPDEATASAFVESCRAADPGASHHCWAWRIHGEESRSSDDGEPRGTGGPPILRYIEGAGIEEVVIVVVRHYGGTKLGTGGLIRAYGGAAGEALREMEVEERDLLTQLTLQFDWSHAGAVESVCRAFDAEETSIDYGEHITRVIGLLPEQVAPFREALRERTSGKVDAD